MGGSTCLRTAWQSDREVVCFLPCSIGGNDLSLAFTVDQSVQTLSLTFTYLPPRISTGNPSNILTFGRQMMSISGDNFGSYTITLAAAVGSTTCEASSWDSDTAMTCKSSRGLMSTLSLVVSIQAIEPLPMKTHAVSYDTGLIYSIAVTNIHSIGSRIVTAVGYGLSPIDFSPRTRLAQTASETTVWISDTLVLCKTSQGHMRTLQLQITTGVNVLSSTEVISYDVAIVSDLTTYNLASIMKQTILVSGISFSHYATTLNGRVSGSRSESSVWLSDTSILAKAAGGALRYLYTRTQLNSVVVTVGGSVGSLTGSITYDLQYVSNSHTGNSAAKGRSPLHLLIVNVGSEDYTISGRSGYSECESSSWISDSTLLCRTVTGFYTSYSLYLTASERAVSLTESFSYNTPSIYVSNWTKTQMENVTVAGIYDETWARFSGTFGSLQQSMIGQIGLTVCEATFWTSDSAVKCKTQFSVARSMQVVLTGGVVVGTSTEALSFGAGRVDKLYQGFKNHSNLFLTTTGPVEILGTFLEHESHTSRMSAGQTDCESTQWVSVSTVLSSVPIGSKTTQMLIFTAGVRIVSTTEMWSFDVLKFSSARLANHASRTTAVTLAGINMGSWDLSQSVRVASTLCQSTFWLSDTSTTCRAAAFSIGATLRLIFTAGNEVSKGTDVFSLTCHILTSRVD